MLVSLQVIEQKPRNEQIDLIKKAVAEKGPFEGLSSPSLARPSHEAGRLQTVREG